MANYLHDADVLWYHPFEPGMVEKVQNRAWSALGLVDPAPGLLGSGICTFMTGGAGNVLSPSGYYRSPLGTTDWTCAVWFSGVPGTAATFTAGWANWTTNRNALAIQQDASASGFTVYGFVRGLYKPGTALFVPPPVSNLKFAVARAEFSGGSVNYFLSINGQPWIAAGTASTAEPDDTGTEVIAEAYQGSGPISNGFDEAIFWTNTPKFTNTELSELYELGATNAQPMDKYVEAFAWPRSRTGTASLFVGAASSASGAVDLRTAGTYAASGQADLFLAMSGSMLEAPLYLHSQGVSGVAPCYLHESHGIGTADLFVYGILGSNRPLFLRTHESTPSGTAPMWLYGSSGNPLAITSAEAPLFLANDGGPATTAASRPAFLKTVPADPQPVTTATYPLFLKAGGGLQGSAALFLQGPFPPAFNEAPLSVFGEGHWSATGTRPLFVKVRTGAVIEVPCSITGFAWPSGTCDLNIFGILGSHNAECPMALAGYNKGEGSVSLTVWGALGVASGEIPMFLGCGTGVSSGTASLYAHGY